MSPVSSLSSPLRVGLLGVGRMGGALARGWRSATPPAAVVVAHDPERSRLAGLDVEVADTPAAVWESDILVLAMKPQGVPAALNALKEHLDGGGDGPRVVVSVAAGVSLGALRRALGSAPVALVRTMPNTPAEVGRGMTTLVAEPGTAQGLVARVVELFRAVGAVEELADERLMHAATAVAGSGPAFVFAFAEALADGAVAEGLPRELARELAARTLEGAAALLLARGAIGSPADLRDAVASPAGTTIEGLLALEDGRFRATVAAAVRAASRRSRSLGDGA